ncbi:protein containing DUF1559 [Rhodopirellula sp. SWK7]|nr:protein containing DUF1559 [Rhodopirellula sp. SWK7]
MRRTHRGVFGRRYQFRLRDILDGTSNTLLMAERVIPTKSKGRVAKNLSREKVILGPDACRVAVARDDTLYWKPAEGMSWPDGSLLSIGFQAILPPNSASCTTEQGILEGVMTVSSRHGNGAHVLVADGAVAFVSATIDAGSASNPSVAVGNYGDGKPAFPGVESPYGVWGALGSRACRESIDTSKVWQAPKKSITKEQLAEYATLPLQSWRPAGRRGSVMARQIDVEEDGTLILMDKSNKIHRIGLSRFENEDAYRAVETKRNRQTELLKTLDTDLEAALKLLETRQYEKFIQDYVHQERGGSGVKEFDLRKVTAELEVGRGELIARLDALLANRELLKSVGRERINRGQVGVSQVLEIGQLKLIMVAGRWKLTF